MMSWSCRRSINVLSAKRLVKRYQSTTALHFYQNRQLELYASKEAKRLTLRQLVWFGRSMDQDRLIKSANYVRTELPIRIAHRLRDLQALPYVVVTREGVAKVYELYWDAFEKFRRYPQINTLEDNDAFCEFLTGLLNEHAIVIPNLSLGLSLSSPYLPPEQLDAFMRRMLVSRISRRVLTEHHIALSRSFSGPSQESPDDDDHHVGIIYTNLNVRKSIEKCVNLLRARPHDIENSYGEPRSTGWPEVIVDGHLETSFPYFRDQLEYIVFELLKNSMRATTLKHHDAPALPPIRTTIVAGANDISIRITDQGGGLVTPYVRSPSDLLSFSHIRNSTRMEDARLGALRTASSSQQGVRATVDEQVGRWQQNPAPSLSKLEYENPERQPELHPRIGIGLAMSDIFANYFGGSLELVSLDGWGTDVYLRLPKLGTNLEGIEV